jgi:hypothetical protein
MMDSAQAQVIGDYGIAILISITKRLRIAWHAAQFD